LKYTGLFATHSAWYAHKYRAADDGLSGDWWIDNGTVWHHNSTAAYNTPDNPGTFRIGDSCYTTHIDYVFMGTENMTIYLTPSTITLGTEETSDQAPTISSLTMYPSTVYDDTDVNASATAVDDRNTTLLLEYNWSVDGAMIVHGNMSASNNTSADIPELGSGNYSTGQVINCSVRAWDGTSWGGWNSTKKTVSSAAAADDFDSGVISTGNFTINPLGTVLIVGNSSNAVKLQMYSPDNSAFCCGPDNEGTWSCSAGAC